MTFAIAQATPVSNTIRNSIKNNKSNAIKKNNLKPVRCTDDVLVETESEDRPGPRRPGPGR